MKIIHENFESGILEVHVSGKADAETAFELWGRILKKSDELDARGLLYSSDVADVLVPSGAMRLMEILSKSSITALAYVREVIPDASQVGSLTAIAGYAREIGINMRTFYNREEALNWLLERIGPIA